MLEIITPSGLFYLGNVGSATVRAREGDECYAFGHPLACKLFGEAELWIRGVGEITCCVARIKKGFISVNGYVSVFADTAEWVETGEDKHAIRRRYNS